MKEIKSKENIDRINLSDPKKNMLVRKYLKTTIINNCTIVKEYNPVCDICADNARGNKFQYDNKILCSSYIDNLDD